MLSRVGVGVAAVLLFVAPADMLLELFVADQLQVDLVRLVAGVALGWALLEAWAVWREIPIRQPWSLIGLAGVAMLAFGLVASMPTLIFFSFPLLVGSVLSTSLGLAESWRTAILAQGSGAGPRLPMDRGG